MDDRSLLAEMKALLEVRRREDPLVIAMSNDVKQLRKEVSGQAQCVNLSLGNSRSAVDQCDKNREEIAVLRQIVMLQADTITGMQNELNSVKSDLKAAMDRLDKASEYLRTKGMK